MLAGRGLKLFIPIVGLMLLALSFVALRFYDERVIKLPWNHLSGPNGKGTDLSSLLPFSGNADEDSSPSLADAFIQHSHRRIKSPSTKDGRYFMIEFGEFETINPNIIPHPSLPDTWILVAQKKLEAMHVFTMELVCNAVFRNGRLACLNSPMDLPIASSQTDKCEGNYQHLVLSIGPHDARVFYGPQRPYTVYGSNSGYTCFGQWMQDFRTLIEWSTNAFEIVESDYRVGTELQRPPPFGQIEKNWFVFWDVNNQSFVHYDTAPKRAFAQLNANGSSGPDLAPLAAAQDEKCLAKYLPKLGNPDQESIHQATNSLRITMCSRHDPTCIPSAANTYILSIFQHKLFYRFHPTYEPYVMLFSQSAPFELHAISTKPLWIHGRGGIGKGRPPIKLEESDKEGWLETEMMYVTSISWKTHGQKYDGFIDDILYLAFGIEDQTTGAIDVVASDILQDLGLCP